MVFQNLRSSRKVIDCADSLVFTGDSPKETLKKEERSKVTDPEGLENHLSTLPNEEVLEKRGDIEMPEIDHSEDQSCSISKEFKLNNLRKASNPKFIKGVDTITCTWVYPKEVSEVKVYSGSFADLDWEDGEAVKQRILTATLCKSIGIEEYKVKKKLELAVPEDRSYDLLFVPVVNGEDYITDNVLLDNPRRRRIIYWQKVEEKPGLVQRLQGMKTRTSLRLWTDDNGFIADDMLTFRFEQTIGKVSQVNEVEIASFQGNKGYETPSYVGIQNPILMVNDGYENVIKLEEIQNK